MVEESALRIPNMRGIMQARSKPLEVIEATYNRRFNNFILSFEKPAEKGACKLVDADNVAELVTYCKMKQKLFN